MATADGLLANERDIFPGTFPWSPLIPYFPIIRRMRFRFVQEEPVLGCCEALRECHNMISTSQNTQRIMEQINIQNFAVAAWTWSPTQLKKPGKGPS